MDFIISKTGRYEFNFPLESVNRLRFSMPMLLGCFAAFYHWVGHGQLRSPWVSQSTTNLFVQNLQFNPMNTVSLASCTPSRVSKVVADHDDLLTHWRYIQMSKLRANIFLTPTTSNYLWSSVVCKNQNFKVDCFDLTLFWAPNWVEKTPI